MWYLTFPILFFIFFVIVGATAVAAHIHCRRPSPPVPSVVRMAATVRQKSVLCQAHDQKMYRAVFSMQRGGTKVLFLTRAQYSVLVVGMRGVLVYRGKQFLCFEQDEK